MSEVDQPGTGNPNQLFNAYQMEDSLTKAQWVGGSYDNISAVTIACAWYMMRQNAAVSNSLLVGVFDESDTPIAFIGRAK